MNAIPPYILLLLATVLWGGNFVIGKAVADHVPPFTLAFYVGVWHSSSFYQLFGYL